MESDAASTEPTPDEQTPEVRTEFGFQRILPPAAMEPENTPTVPFAEAIAAHRAERRNGLRILRLLGLAFILTLLVGGGYALSSFGLLDHYLNPTIAAPAQPPLAPSERERILAENIMLKHELIKAEKTVGELEALLLTQANSHKVQLAGQSTAHAAALAALEAENAAARTAAEEATAALLAIQQNTPEEGSPEGPRGGLPPGWEFLNQRGPPYLW